VLFEAVIRSGYDKCNVIEGCGWSVDKVGLPHSLLAYLANMLLLPHFTLFWFVS